MMLGSIPSFAFIGFQEVAMILLIAVVVFGPKKIPEIARGLGEGIRAMRNATDDIKREIMDTAKDSGIQQEVEKTQEQIEGEISKAKQELDDMTGPIHRNK